MHYHAILFHLLQLLDIFPQKDFRPWITLGIRKSSKRKQRPYEKFLKSKTAKSEEEYKTYKNMFGTIKRKSKRNTIPKKYLNIKITLKNMEYYEGDNRQNKQIRVKVVINKNDETSEIGISNDFNKFFTNIGPELAEKIPTASRTLRAFYVR